MVDEGLRERVWAAIERMTPSDPDRGPYAWTMDADQLAFALQVEGLPIGSEDLVRLLVTTDAGRKLRVQHDGRALHFRSARRTNGIVRLRRLVVEGLGALPNFEMDFSEGPAGHGQWTILIGENGVGKTTILRALALAIYGNADVPRALLAAMRGRPVVRSDADAASISVITSHGQWDARVGRSAEGEYVQSSGMRAAVPFPMVGYGCARGSALGGGDQGVSFGEAEMLATLFDSRAALIHADTWLKNLRLGALESPRQSAIYEHVRETLMKLLPGVESVDVRSSGTVLRGPRVGTVPLASASDGYLTMAGWVVDLIARWTERRASTDGALPENFASEMTGLVLVDEIDLHLHPRWQRRVVSELREAFPKLSFVVTTHNPLTLLGAAEGEIEVLRRDVETGAVRSRQLDVPKGMRADQVLTGEWFDLPSTLDDETLQMLEKHRLLLRENPEAPEAAEALAELQARLGSYGDTAIERLALSVAGTVLDRSSPPLSAEERKAAREEIRRIVARSSGVR